MIEALRTTIALLTTGAADGLWYRIVGGVGVDGHVGHLTRNHADIDGIVLEEDLPSLLEALDRVGYELYPWKIKFSVNDVKVELGRLGCDEEAFWSKTMPEFQWPRQLLEGQEVALEGIRFWVPSKEFLLSTKLEDARPEGEHDRNILLNLGANLEVAREFQFPWHKHKRNFR